MVKKSKSLIPKKKTSSVEGLHSEVVSQEIVDTLEVNYMPYAMSVIVSRAIPEIDGFKPSHRKLLYTMYKMGLLSGNKTKSANIVGQTMRLNPHGDSAIYETMVRLSHGYDALLTPFVDSKGNFGKCYSRDMAYAASRYTEAKLSGICKELFADIDKDTVDFVDNYDGTMKEPRLLPTTYPNVLVSTNTGIAVGMASQICGFNLEEVCKTTIELLRYPSHDVMKTLLAPDFTTGGEILYNEDELRQIYTTGRGSFKVRCRWRYIKEYNIIEVYEIPYSTTVEAIIDKIADLIKTGTVREISDVRDETDLNGLKLTLDLKRGVDPDKLMRKLMKLTPLQDTYRCNFNILIDGTPRVLGVAEILNEWIKWRESCVYRRVDHDLHIKQDKLHLLEGLAKILLDIDKAIQIIRETEKESDVVPNLMSGFEIDKIQAEYVAEIKLRNINKEYILRRTSDIESLISDIEELKEILSDSKHLKNIIIKELKQIIKKYPSPRRTQLVYAHETEVVDEYDFVEDYNVNLFLTRDGYFKKIPATSLRSASGQKYKEGDELLQSISARNTDDVMIFTDKQQVYVNKISEFDSLKPSSIGTYLPSYLKFDKDENAVAIVVPSDYKSNLIFCFENGKAAKIPLSAYQTKNRKKLTGAYSPNSRLVSLIDVPQDTDIQVNTTDGRCLIFNTSKMSLKSSRTAQGSQVIMLKKDSYLKSASVLDKSLLNVERYRPKNIPATGVVLREEDLA